ncbi:TPA: helix-turn-helix transcriptional regulator [Vibrio parahaemolyticus]|uniref:helix-turn-helix transcriptional regulator n=1 Tax=Vibrio parahaemolyticus TaxID=670 RepID=UPI000FEC3E93|nr:AlpA family transcriptional regulator [Vibrio parahaemolyticus]MCX8885157.1 AlpA family transcriptional regulator [Vibrio parahaemolyticus]HAS3030137.1 AlpA family transcriptional regulator [Vibrio parahaemolyticus]HAS3035414.1 AlpA family transcriptional regulator [Vibrio parahaemolyticus]HAS3040809.1 AlpA family transcriptional regulator [Vibrio parahaemolyticus]HAS3056878.1 AlpA family transcriptional regulator [Vibrio parahaemolyticus]
MPNTAIRLIRLSEVLAMTGLSRSSMYRSIEEKQFPEQVQLGGRSVAWVESEVQEWIRQRVLKRSL